MLANFEETVTFDKEYLGNMIGTYAIGNEANKLDVIRNINYALELLHKEKVLHDPTVPMSLDEWPQYYRVQSAVNNRKFVEPSHNFNDYKLMRSMHKLFKYSFFVYEYKYM